MSVTKGQRAHSGDTSTGKLKSSVVPRPRPRGAVDFRATLAYAHTHSHSTCCLLRWEQGSLQGLQFARCERGRRPVPASRCCSRDDAARLMPEKVLVMDLAGVELIHILEDPGCCHFHSRSVISCLVLSGRCLSFCHFLVETLDWRLLPSPCPCKS